MNKKKNVQATKTTGKLGLLVAAVLALSGCHSLRVAKLRALNEKYEIGYERALLQKYKNLNQYIENNYDAKVGLPSGKGTKDPAVANLRAKDLRNRILDELIWLSDAEYYRYKESVFNTRSTFEFVSDVLILGTSTAGTLIGSTGVKTILSATTA
jgi:hypothetical protein